MDKKNKRKWISDDEAQKLFEDSIPEAAKEMGLKNPLLSKQRYRIIGKLGDDYFVPVEQEREFYLWAESFEADLSTYSGPDFKNNLIDGRLTFTDPKVEK